MARSKFSVDSKATLASQLTAALAALASCEAELEKLDADIVAKSGRVTELEAAATAKQAELDVATQKAVKAEKDLADANAALLAANEKVTAFEAKVNAKAQDIAAGQGIPPVAVKPDAAAGGSATLDEVRAQIKAEKDPAKRAALNAKARELRGLAQKK